MKISIFLLIILLGACSTVSKNIVKSGSLTLGSFYNNDGKLIDELKMIRHSWYQEMTLVHDLNLFEVRPGDEKTALFSAFELKKIKTCEQFFVVFSYSQDSQKITYAMLREQLEIAGYHEVGIPDFKKKIKLHPEYDKYSLKLYSIGGFCGKAKKHIMIDFPGYRPSRVFI